MLAIRVLRGGCRRAPPRRRRPGRERPWWPRRHLRAGRCTRDRCPAVGQRGDLRPTNTPAHTANASWWPATSDRSHHRRRRRSPSSHRSPRHAATERAASTPASSRPPASHHRAPADGGLAMAASIGSTTTRASSSITTPEATRTRWCRRLRLPTIPPRSVSSVHRATGTPAVDEVVAPLVDGRARTAPSEHVGRLGGRRVQVVEHDLHDHQPAGPPDAARAGRRRSAGRSTG